jgi:dihydropyrimidine dehydrogenase (NAD+) subunit PreT
MTTQSNCNTHRLDASQIAENFSDLQSPLSSAEAAVEADRCYFCYDAPCTLACPTGIDIPLFIQKIRSGNITGSARTILSENIMGAMCSRDCPTEILCEQVCVRNDLKDKPVKIGALQRFATDPVVTDQRQLFDRGAETGKRVAVVGAGPAGLSCAHRLSMFGHAVSVFEARDKIAGLNEYGIAAYKATDNIAASEAQYILGIGGIEVKTNLSLGVDISLADLRQQYDAVFLSVGLAATRQLGIGDDDTEGIIDAVDYIADLRQAPDKGELPVGKRIIVIGGGMTAIDIAVQSKLLGAEDVTIAYRRGQAQMGASEHEQELAQIHGIQIKHWLSPHQILKQNGRLSGVEFIIMAPQEDGSLTATGEMLSLRADIVFKAIGQLLVSDSVAAEPELALQSQRIVVNSERRTSLPDVWAGGDCVLDGENLTVAAVQDGKLAAISINQYLSRGED